MRASGMVLLAVMALVGPSASLAFAESVRTSRGAPSGDAGGDVVPADINIAVGSTQILSARGVRNYSEGSPGVIDVKLTSDNNQFVVSGRRAGSTTLLLIKSDGTQESYMVNVFARSPAAVEQELRQLLAGIPTVRITRVGSRNLIDGYVQDESEKARVDRVATLYPGQVESVVSLGFTAATAPAVIGGSAQAGGTAAKAQRTVLIRIDFYFVQMNTSSAYAVGLGWPRSLGGAAVGRGNFVYDFLTRATTQAAVTVAQPLPQLDMAEDNGWGKVLRHATVVTNNGQEATFESGGEQNFTVNTGLTVGLQKVTFGLEIVVVPRFDPARREVELKVKADISDLTDPGQGTTVPGRSTSRLASAVSVKLGQSFVLSGIRSSTQTQHISGLPLLSRIPILGILFGSHQNTEAETEGALYIVPNVIDSIPEGSRELIDVAVSKFRDYDGETLPPVSASLPAVSSAVTETRK